MRILMISQFFEPEPTVRGLDLAKRLTELGHEVRVITGFPNYPGGKVYEGYRIGWPRSYDMEGIKVTRVPLYPSHSQSKFGRIANYLSFMLSAALYGLFTSYKAEVIYVYHPPLTVSLAAAVVGAVRGIPFVPDIQDLWPDTLRATGMINNDKVLDRIGKVALWVYRRATLVCVQSPGFRRRLIERGVPEDKVRYIPNWCNEAALAPVPAAPDAEWRALFDGKFVLLSAGNMGKAQAVDAVLDAAKIVAASNKDVRFVFVGGGVEVERLKKRVADEGIANAVFLPPRPLGDMPKLFALADALLVHLRKDELFTITIPSRIQAYLYSGKPVVVGVAGDASAILQESGAGIAAESENAPSIAAAVLKLAALAPEERQALGKAGRAYYDSHFSARAGAQRFADLFATAAERYKR